MHIGECIRGARLEAGLTQKQLAEKCDMAEITIRQYENGRREPKHRQLEKIAAALEITTIDLSLWGLMHSPYRETIDKMSKPEIIKLMNEALKEAKDISSREEIILSLFGHLNNKGQDKAIEQVELLTKIPEYRKDKE